MTDLNSCLGVSSLQLRLSPILAAAEIVRRFMWAVLRLEKEHLDMYSTNGRRAVLQVAQPEALEGGDLELLSPAPEEEDTRSPEVVRLLEVHPAMAIPVSAEESVKRKKKDLIQLDGLVLSTSEAALHDRPDRKQLLKEGGIFLVMQAAMIIFAMTQ